MTQINEVQLMHHYTAYTCLTISENPVLTSLWKEVVPKHAFQHQFLLYGIFAIAAWHKLRDQHDNPVDLIYTANLYQQKALPIYINLLSNIDKENCHALFAFSQLIVAISYSRLRLGIDEKHIVQQWIITAIVEIFGQLKGALVVAEKASAWLCDGDLKPMMGAWPELRLPQRSLTRNPGIKALLSLSDHISGQIDDGVESKGRVESLLSTIQLLYTVFLEDCESADRRNKIIGLPVFFDTEYINLLRAQDDASLVILSYYGVALHQIRHVWYLDGIGAKIVQAIAHLIGPDWSSHLTWPQMEVGVLSCNEGIYGLLDASPFLSLITYRTSISADVCPP
jgi:hypothetical protein